jgi:hypothetical protein
MSWFRPTWSTCYLEVGGSPECRRRRFDFLNAVSGQLPDCRPSSSRNELQHIRNQVFLAMPRALPRPTRALAPVFVGDGIQKAG